jgi:hypothetical protein
VGIKGKEKFIANLEFTANQGKGVLTIHSITLNVDSPKDITFIVLLLCCLQIIVVVVIKLLSV